jgi:HD-GYP domain-containing protein (c-di-GMP phosphodiesterase class II)
MSKNSRIRQILVLGCASLVTALALAVVAELVGVTTAIVVLVFIMWISVWRITRSNRKETATLKSQLQAARSNTDAIVEQLCEVLGMRDSVRDRELERLSRMASILVRQMRIPTEQAALVDQAAALRDIGKRGVAQSVLLKEEDFTEQDWKEMKRHPEIGYRILSEVTFFRELSEVVRCHHERYDGQGYPRGVSGEKIPVAARILCVLDAYVAMTSERPYRKTRTHEDAMQEILRHAGTQFDPVVVRALADAERRGLFGEGREFVSALDDRDARVASEV